MQPHTTNTNSAAPTLSGRRAGRAEGSPPPASSPLGPPLLPHRLATIYPLPAIKVILPADPDLARHLRRQVAIERFCRAALRQMTGLEIAVAVLGLSLVARAILPALFV